MPNASEASANAGPGVHCGEPGSHSRNSHFDQGIGADYPDFPGFKWSDTSREAAEAIAPKLGRLQRMALNAIRARGVNGLTAEELADVLGVDRASIQPRSSELRRKGLVVDSGARRRNASSGRSAICWVTPEHKRGDA